ncbi:phosphate regulon transcriptional regulatory protein PhoB (SphR) [Candidatus Pelagibacter sp. IMCC9063]|jgi:two-component system phosphate regulon response regulator PhoB|uniref:phosphate regulon transcriptional regulator PhoB n=1 Tax=Pelagibacter sp. (strain IMCC9063) TaxID=1002672 RepID=UPI00020465C3|nr:phosphate regulon transcriptional regulator PhoB [Candidatus Pelagibacter sp. IMCC9063]AEA80670.1 phosphate regulon transcriptional regulatory protein PhoB (SphR) [Candidatus Pelagibacter sp. IMCC9063]|tara:strand:+ start:5353 stop:6039 length:687 start_codon:yes stop_codon:yes gene_type:complete
MKAKIFIVEDEPSIATLVKYNLEKENYKVFISNNGEEGLKEIKKIEPDLILLDWMLPDLSGIEICRSLKKDKKFKFIPIIMLTAKGQEEDKVLGLNTGADDYLVKPFSHSELVARINALLRRVKPQAIEDSVTFEDLKVDRLQKRVSRGSQQIILGPTEYRLINFFITNPRRVFSREQLLENVWLNSINVELRTVDVHIRRLRKAINLPGKKDLIRTVRSTGYSLDNT